jgi:hypothetical protein
MADDISELIVKAVHAISDIAVHSEESKKGVRLVIIGSSGCIRSVVHDRIVCFATRADWFRIGVGDFGADPH